MKLLYTKRSPYARKVRIVALEKGIDLKLLEEDLLNKSDLLCKSNPVSKIPTLILDNGDSLIDSPVICEYLDSLNKNPLLIPANGKERFAVLKQQAIADGLMDVTVRLYFEKLWHPKDANEKFVNAQQKIIENCLAHLDTTTGQFKGLDLGSIATACALGYIDLRFKELNPKGKYPTLQSWFSKFSDRSSLQSTIPVV